MADPHGGSGYWCPDCGTSLATAQVICTTCGLDFSSRAARDIERANGELHRLQAQLDSLNEQNRKWTEYRGELLAIAPRRSDAAGKVTQEASEPPPPDVLASVPPSAAPPLAISNPSAAAQAQAPAAPAPLPAHIPPYRGEGWRASTAMRPARRLSAAVLLGVSGAALIILAGIVFVAASWSTYGPAARMAILLVFAATFAWLATTATRKDFATVGGALGVVSAAFMGVGVYALTAGPEGPAPYTLAIASFVAGLAGLGLARLRIGAVGAAASGAVVFAVEAAAVEAALRAGSVVDGLTLYAVIASAGAGALIATRAMWTSSAQRSIAIYGGFGVAFAGALGAVLAPLSAGDPDIVPFAALLASVIVCAGISAWRPRWGAGVLTAVMTVGAASAASMWHLTVSHLVFVGALATALVLAGLGRVPVGWRGPGMRGLIPALALIGTLFVFTLPQSLVVALVGGDAADRHGLLGDNGLVWSGVGLLFIAALVPVAMRFEPPALTRPAVLGAFSGGVFAAATVSIAVGIGTGVAHTPAASGAGLVVAAGVQWWCARWWPGLYVKALRLAAVAIATLGGIHGALTFAIDETGRAGLWWATAAVVLSLVSLAAASVAMPRVAGAWSLVAFSATAAWAWTATGQGETVVVAVSVAALVLAFVATRLPPRYAGPVLVGSVPAYVVGAMAVAVGATVASVSSYTSHPPSLDLPGVWAPLVSVCAALLGPIVAVLVTRAGSSDGRPVAVAVSGAGFIGLTLFGLASAQGALFSASDERPELVDSIAPALALVVAGVAFAVVSTVKWWRPARWPVGVGVVVIVSGHGLTTLGGLATDRLDLWLAVASVLAAAAALGVASRWVPRVTLAPAVLLASLTASAALAPRDGEIALAAAVMATAGIAWAARRAHQELRVQVLLGGVGVGPVAAAALVIAAGTSIDALVRLYAGESTAWRPWLLLVVAAAYVALLAWGSARRVAGALGGVILVLAAGFVPGPLGWIGLVLAGLAGTEIAARWQLKVGLHPYVPLVVSGAAVAWAGGAGAASAIALGALAAGALVTAVRAQADGAVRSVALVLAPLAGSVAVGVGLGAAHVDPLIAMTVAVGTALTMPLVAAATGLDKDRRIAVGVLTSASVVGPVIPLDLAFAGLAVIMACAAWFTLSTLGVKWARWVALGGLSVAAVLLAADLGIATLEAYTAVPAISMVGVGLWWIRRDPRVRTYVALAPGLGVALVPSYLALLVQPDVFMRLFVLLGAAVVLAIAGVALKWFAPLLATALTAVVAAVSQLLAEEALTPVWVSVAVIGGVMFALALLAERMKAMR